MTANLPVLSIMLHKPRTDTLMGLVWRGLVLVAFEGPADGKHPFHYVRTYPCYDAEDLATRRRELIDHAEALAGPVKILRDDGAAVVELSPWIWDDLVTTVTTTAVPVAAAALAWWKEHGR